MAHAKAVWDNRDMGKVRSVWDGYRHLRAVRDLTLDILGYLGVKTIVTGAIGASGIAVWAWFRHLADVQVFVLAMGTVAIIVALSVAIQKRDEFKVRYQPRLVYDMTECVGGWAFCVPLNVCMLTVMQIRNSQTAVKNLARGVKASLDYIHASGDRVHIGDAVWKNINPQDHESPGASLTSELSLAANESQGLVIIAQQRDTSKFFVLRDRGNSFDPLYEGHWSVRVQVTSESCNSLILRGGFTVLSLPGGKMGLEPDKPMPLFKTKQPWSLKNWRG